MVMKPFFLTSIGSFVSRVYIKNSIKLLYDKGKITNDIYTYYTVEDDVKHFTIPELSETDKRIIIDVCNRWKLVKADLMSSIQLVLTYVVLKEKKQFKDDQGWAFLLINNLMVMARLV